jgi:8-oxo-dGTP pyrophosphatase MutT (NUDIX family)
MGSDLISKPLPAAIVMLLRDGDDGVEVFMIVRHHKSDVHAGALVFPGGRVDAEDYELAVDATVFPSQDGVDAATAVLRVAAVRETFEECGVLLASARGEEALVSADRLRDIDRASRRDDPRAAVPKRFDTHFFLAAAPLGQVARPGR